MTRFPLPEGDTVGRSSLIYQSDDLIQLEVYESLLWTVRGGNLHHPKMILRVCSLSVLEYKEPRLPLRVPHNLVGTWLFLLLGSHALCHDNLWRSAKEYLEEIWMLLAFQSYDCSDCNPQAISHHYASQAYHSHVPNKRGKWELPLKSVGELIHLFSYCYLLIPLLFILLFMRALTCIMPVLIACKTSLTLLRSFFCSPLLNLCLPFVASAHLPLLVLYKKTPECTLFGSPLVWNHPTGDSTWGVFLWQQ